jgi:hypothetical protein
VLVATPWVTYAGIFPIAAMLAWAWIAWAWSATAKERRDLLIVSLVFTVSFVACYFISTSHQVSAPRLMIYWRTRMLGDEFGSFPHRLATGVTEYLRLAFIYFFWDQWRPFAVLSVIGAITWPRPHRLLLVWIFAGTAAACIAAALTDHYLIAHGRHLLIALPPLLLWTAQGLWTLARPFGPRLRPLATLALPIAFAISCSIISVEKRLGPYRTNMTEFYRYDVLHDTDEAITRATALIDPDDDVLVSQRMGYPFQFYQRDRLPRARYCYLECTDWEGYAADWLAGAGGRAWLLLTDEEEKRMPDFLAAHGFSYKERVSVRGVRVWELEHST